VKVALGWIGENTSGPHRENPHFPSDAGRGECPSGVTGRVKEAGEVAGVAVAEDETVMLYCVFVTQRYVQEGQVDVDRERAAVGHGDPHGDPVGASGAHGERRRRRGAGAQAAGGGVDVGDGDGGSVVHGHLEVEVPGGSCAGIVCNAGVAEGGCDGGPGLRRLLRLVAGG